MGGGGKDPKRRGVLSEINVTPLVDVMLVLLIIFMIAAGAEKVDFKRQERQLQADAQAKLEEAEELLMEAEREANKYQRVEVDLPKVTSEPVNLAEVMKLKLEVNDELVFRVGKRKILSCLQVSPEMKAFLDPAAAAKDPEGALKAFEPCLQQLGDKLVDNKKVQEDKEIYLLADRRLSYDHVLRIMATVRQAGVKKFGLVAEKGILGDAKSEKTAPEVP